MKKVLPIPKGVFALLLALSLGMGTAYAYSFSATCSTGQTLYYNIINSTQHYVEITSPGTFPSPWDGYTEPTGNITLPSSVTHNGVNYTVTKIGEGAFYYCSGLTGSLTIPYTVTSIASYAFLGCSGFTGSLNLPTSVTTIGNFAFGYSNFTGQLTVPTSVTTIGNNAFVGCVGFTSLLLNSGITSIGDSAFKNCTGLTVASFFATNCADFSETGRPFEGCSGILDIGYTVQKVPAHLTKGANFTHVWFEATNCADVTSSDKPFEGCGGTLSINSDVERIPAYMFYECSGFTGALTIPNTVTYIGNNAFDGCSGFAGSLTMSNTVTTIGAFAFRSCSGFTGTLTIPSSVTSIGDHAFKNCTGFTQVNYNATNCADLYFGSDNSPFYGCVGTLTIGTTVQRIPQNMFFDCTVLTGSLTIPNSVTSIGPAAFTGCMGLTGSLTIPNSVTSIGTSAFQACSGFTGSLTIGTGLTSIGSSAFNGCTGFTSMNVLPETPPTLGTSVFQNIPTSIPVYVPCASLEDYQAASGWSAFTNMQCRETLTVYEGTSTNRNVPAYIYYFDDFTRSQFVIPYYELGDMLATPISSMTFYTTSSNVPYTTTCSADVYLKEVGYGSTISAFEPKSSATIVYSGTLSIVSTGSGGEMTINFSTPYTYNGGSLLVGIENTARGGFKNIYFYGQTVNGASISGSNSSGLDYVQPTQQNFIPKTTFGYTPYFCSRPIGLTATNITPSSAVLEWTGYQDSYTVQYMSSGGFFYDFENGLDGWTVIRNGEGTDETDWQTGNIEPYSGEFEAISRSYYSGYPYTVDNWLITPRVTLDGTLTFWVKCDGSYPEHYQVYVSTSGTAIDNFSPLNELTAATGVWTEIYLDLSMYAGQQGYVAIRHQDTDMDYLEIDDFEISYGSSWITVSNVTSPLTIEGLTPGTSYSWQVKGLNCSGYGNYTPWSATHSFTTTDLCAPEDQCQLTFELYDDYGDGWNGAAIQVYDEATGILLATLTNNNLNGTTGYGTNELNTLTLAVCDGRELRFEWVSGSWDSECSYIVTDANGIEIFSGSGAMSAPVTYMVNCDPTQTIVLSSGANWVSFNVELTLDDLKAALVEAVPNTEITIQEQSNNVKYNPNTHRWTGRLTELDLSKMYKISVAAGCVLTLEGAFVDPADHPATIGYGANWIAFPLREEKTPSEAFAGFAQSGDKVQSQTQNASYNGTRWTGRLTTLEPGQGYIYQSGVSEDRMLSFGHAYVDLGLPSGLLWATCNVGAASPEDYGDYFAWGETTPKDTYNWSTYQYCNGSQNTMTKYCNNSSYGYEGFTDDLTTLLPEDDAATANWGPDWRMPTKAEWQELLDNTTVIWTTQNGVSGRLFTAANGNSLFLPAAGYRYNSSLYNAGSYSYYWSSSLYTGSPYDAWYFNFASDYYRMGYFYRGYGRSVRPVRSASQN